MNDDSILDACSDASYEFDSANEEVGLESYVLVQPATLQSKTLPDYVPSSHNLHDAEKSYRRVLATFAHSPSSIAEAARWMMAQIRARNGTATSVPRNLFINPWHNDGRAGCHARLRCSWTRTTAPRCSMYLVSCTPSYGALILLPPPTPTKKTPKSSF